MAFILYLELFNKGQVHLVNKTNWICLDLIRFDNSILLKTSLNILLNTGLKQNFFFCYPS